MARKSAAPTTPPEEIFADEQDLLPPGVSPETTSGNEINLNIQRAEEQLLDLKRQQEEIERQKKELDELSRKQREFNEGRREIVEKLTRGLVLLEREEFEVKRELEQIRIVRESFSEHLGQTADINPAEWATEELPSELTKSLARVDQAKAIYSQSRARLLALRQAEDGQANDAIGSELAPEGTVSYEKSIGAMIREGFFYALPACLFAVLLLLAYLAVRH